MSERRWPYTTSQWQKLRAMHLNEKPLCAACMNIGIVSYAKVVDHIIPVSERKDLAFDSQNLQSLCAICHSAAKQREEIRGHQIGHDRSGVPVDPSHHWNR